MTMTREQKTSKLELITFVVTAVFLATPGLAQEASSGTAASRADILAMSTVSMEEAWDVLRLHGFDNQFERGWEILHPDRAFVGRAVTANYLPARPDLVDRVTKAGESEGRIGPSNSWPIDMLQKGDVYIAAGFGKITDGTLMGDNLGNAIYTKSGTGVVFDAGSRDLTGLKKIDGFNAFVRGWDPTVMKDMVMASINRPIRIGRITVLPGDVILANAEGVMAIPAHLAEEVVVTAEVVALKDAFGHARLREGVYTAGQIDVKWTAPIKADFYRWLNTQPGRPAIPQAEIEKHL
jgi:regulator of RNase E activity RraA